MSKRTKRDIYAESTKALDTMLSRYENTLDREFVSVLRNIKNALANAYENFGNDGILTREEMIRYGRLTKLERYLLEQIRNLNKAQIRLTKEAILDMFQESYYRNGYMIETETEFQIYQMLNKENINQNLYSELNPIRWDERVKINNEVMLRQLIEDVNQALIMGVTYDVISKMITKRITVGSNKGKNIIRQEGRRVQEKAIIDAMDTANDTLVIKGMHVRKQWLSAKDSRTRHTHRGLDGQIVELDEEFVSPSGAKAIAPRQFGIPAEDAHCRCTTLHAFFDEDENRIGGKQMRARNNGDNQIGVVVPSARYHDWKKSLEGRK